MRVFALAMLVLSVCCAPALAQERATTASGKQVILYPDGTWKPAPSAPATGGTGGKHTRPAASTEKTPIGRGHFALYFNPKKWKLEKAEEGGRSSFEHVTGDGHSIVITERVQISLDNLREIALSNAKSAAPDARITFEEKRQVNGLDVLVLQMQGTISGIQFIYFGYYYSGKEGTIQVLTFTAQNLFDEYKADFEEFLDGFSAVEG